jgi:hypothetical protein
MLDFINDFGNALDTVERLKVKLKGDPDEAAKYLAGVLEELSKTFREIDAELTDYLGIWFVEEDIQSIIDNRKLLIGLEGGRTRVRMAEARGHCSKIEVIYSRKLVGWFDRVFKNNQSDDSDMKSVFRMLSTCDGIIINGIDELADWLENRAHQIIEFIGRKNYITANLEIEKDRMSLLDSRKKLSKAMVKLYYLQADFIDLSKAL